MMPKVPEYYVKLRQIAGSAESVPKPPLLLSLLLENYFSLHPDHQNVAKTIVLAVAVGRDQDVDNERKLAIPRYQLLWS